MFAFEHPKQIVGIFEEIKEFRQQIFEIERVFGEIQKEVQKSVTANVEKQLDKLQNDTEEVLKNFLSWYDF